MGTGTTRLGIAGIGAALLLTVVPGHAQTYDKLTYLTFRIPVQVPGATLPPGTYRFQLADPDTTRRVMQVVSRDRSRLYATFVTLPSVRRQPTDISVVTFGETRSGVPLAIRTLYYGGERTGYRFIYPGMFELEPGLLHREIE